MAPRKRDDDFVVEKILDKRVGANGRCSYLIKWKGYSTAENTWEPESHVTNCRELVEEFEKKKKTKRRSRRTNKRSSRQLSNNSSSLFTEDDEDENENDDELDAKQIDEIVRVRRNPRTKRVEYEIQLKASEKKRWIPSAQLIATDAVRLVEFFETNFIQ